MNELSKGLTVDMFPEGTYKNIAQAIGPENFVKLAEVVGGATIYIPKPESLTRPVRDARIKAEFNGYNHLELARKYDVTERWVRQICGEGHIEGQISIADFFSDEGADKSKSKP
jgi:Mor family transcriptional regulator